MDRIDMQIEVNSIDCNKLYDNESESSATIKERIERARMIQSERYKTDSIKINSKLSGEMIKKYCEINLESQKLMKSAFSKLNLTIRGYYKILKIARTIADLDGEEKIQTKHVAEAIQYRRLDRKYECFKQK